MKQKTVVPILIIDFIVMCVIVVLNLIMCAGVHFPLGIYIDFPTLLLILLFTIFSLLVSGQTKAFFNIFTIGKKEYRLIDVKKSLEAVKLTKKYVLCGSLLPLVLAGILLLSNYYDLDSKVLGPNFAVAFITVFYCIIIEFFLVTIESFVQNKITEMMDIEDEEA